MAGGHTGSSVYSHMNKNAIKNSSVLSTEYKALPDDEKRQYENRALELNNRELTHSEKDARTISMNRRIRSLLCEAQDIGISSSITLRFPLTVERNGESFNEQNTSFCTVI